MKYSVKSKEEAKYVIGEEKFKTSDPKSACEKISSLKDEKPRVSLDIENDEFYLFENDKFAVGAADNIADRNLKAIVFKKMADLLKELVSAGMQIKLVDTL